MGTNKLLWVPRILAMLYILFLFLFSLDVFSLDGTALSKIGGFLIHNIPSILLIIILILTWKRAFIGGAAFILFGLLTIAFFRTYIDLSALLSISVAAVIIGGLYLLFGRKPKKKEIQGA